MAIILKNTVASDVFVGETNICKGYSGEQLVHSKKSIQRLGYPTSPDIDPLDPRYANEPIKITNMSDDQRIVVQYGFALGLYDNSYYSYDKVNWFTTNDYFGYLGYLIIEPQQSVYFKAELPTDYVDKLKQEYLSKGYDINDFEYIAPRQLLVVANSFGHSPISISGNIMSMLGEYVKTIDQESAFKYLFHLSTDSAIDFNVIMPAMKLSPFCYANCVEFIGSPSSPNNLSRTPDLPAVILPEGCYYRMFRISRTNLNNVGYMPIPDAYVKHNEEKAITGSYEGMFTIDNYGNYEANKEHIISLLNPKFLELENNIVDVYFNTNASS